MTFKIHPVSEAFPYISGAAWDEFVQDIKANGQRLPILVVTKGGESWVADGKNRLKACQALGIDPILEEWDGDGSLVALVCSRNRHRRHSSEPEQVSAYMKLKEQLAKEALARSKRGKPDPCVHLYTGVKPDPCVNLTQGSGRASAIAAKASGVSARQSRKIDAVAEASPAKIAEVVAGKKPLGEAHAEIKAEKDAETPPIDALGRPVADKGLWEAFRNTEFNEIVASVAAARRRAEKLSQTAIGHALIWSSLEIDFKNCERHIRFSKPYTVCAYCKAGRGMATCKACHKMGWITKATYDHAPSEMKE